MDEQTLEDKTGFFGRMKYAAIPAAITVGAYFIPEIKAKYNSMSEDKRRKIKNGALWGAEIAGSVVAIMSASKLFRSYCSPSKDE